MTKLLLVFIAILSGVGCTNGIPTMGILFPEVLDIKGSPFQSIVKFESGVFVARGTDMDKISSASLIGSGGETSLSVQKSSDKTVMAPSVDSKIPPGKYTLKISGQSTDLGVYTLEILPASVTPAHIQPGPDRSVLMSESGTTFWTTSISDQLNQVMKFTNRKIYPANSGMAEPPIGAVDLVADRASPTTIHAGSRNAITLGGTGNFVVGEGSVIIGGSNNTAPAADATLLNTHSIQALNHNELVFGGSRTGNTEVPWTSIVHLGAVSTGNASNVILNLSNGDNVIDYQGNSSGSCSVELSYIPSSGPMVDGEGRFYFRNTPSSTPIFHKSNMAFKIGLDDYTVGGYTLATKGFRVIVSNLNGVVIPGQFIARMTCLVVMP